MLRVAALEPADGALPLAVEFQRVGIALVGRYHDAEFFFCPRGRRRRREGVGEIYAEIPAVIHKFRAPGEQRVELRVLPPVPVARRHHLALLQQRAFLHLAGPVPQQGGRRGRRDVHEQHGVGRQPLDDAAGPADVRRVAPPAAGLQFAPQRLERRPPPVGVGRVAGVEDGVVIVGLARPQGQFDGGVHCPSRPAPRSPRAIARARRAV